MVRNYVRKTDKVYNWSVKRERTWDAKKVKKARIEPEHEEFEYMTPDEIIEELKEIEATYDDTMVLHTIKQHFLDRLDKHFK